MALECAATIMFGLLGFYVGSALFIIFISCYGIYKGTFFRGIFGILVAFGFLYTDIKIIRKKRKTKANKELS